MNRFGAFAVHLGISLIIFIILGYIILFHWYPDFFFASDGGWQGIRIVAFVDLVLGPVLTLVVFNKAKPMKELRRDLSIIGTIQAVCLAAGVWVVYSERPIAMVFADGMFFSMTTADYLEVGEQPPELESLPGRGPKWVSVVLPDDLAMQSEIRRRAIDQGASIRTIEKYYVPFSKTHISPTEHGLPVDQLVRRDEQTPFLRQFLEKNGGEVEDYAFIPFGTRFALSILAIRISDQTLHFVVVPSERNPPD